MAVTHFASFHRFLQTEHLPVADKSIELLLVDDDPDFRGTVARRFLRRGYSVHEAACGDEALKVLGRREFDVVVLDLVMPGMGGIEVLEQIKAQHPEVEVVMLTGQGTIDTAVRAMKLGAYDYLTKPFALAELEILLEKAYERRLLRKENLQLKQLLERQQHLPLLVGESPPMRELARLIQRVAGTDKPVLIQGESGTGKELVVRELYRQSTRADKPLVVVNCAAVPEALLESEFFGHEKGSFTGATGAKPGLFEVADGGTLFIDEIGELALSLQAKLLRVLEDGSLRRIGSIKERRVNVRILAATNRNLQAEAAAGRFREDLYYRLNVLSLSLPPLRERLSDLPLLVRHFLGSDWKIDPRAMNALQVFCWPGNVRQLINTIERAKVMSDDQTIEYEDLPAEIIDQVPKATLSTPTATGEKESETLADLQRSHVLEVLQRVHGNKARASRALGIARRSLYRLMDKYDLHQQFTPPNENAS